MNHIKIKGVPSYGCGGMELESQQREPFSWISACVPLWGCYNIHMKTHILETIAAILIILLAFI